MLTESSAERLNAISQKIGGIKHYLEIGVAKGTTFFNVVAEEKYAVDPRFRFKPESRGVYKNEKYYSMTSDEFFYDFIDKEVKFDLIFLDGLHTYSQTLRDFTTSLAMAHAKTIWLIDDTVPKDSIAAEPNLERVKEARLSEGNSTDQTWMGDVFKVVAFIDSFFPQFTCMTTQGHGQTVVIPKANKFSARQFDALDEISRLNYVDTLLLKNTLFDASPFDKILEAISFIEDDN